jgi:phage host-nuclease inhibitor protein Gam
MSDDPDSLILRYLRRIDASLDRIKEDIADLQRRMTTLETQVGQLIATEQSHYAATMQRLDRFGDRLDRIDRRLDLTDQPAV